MAIKKQYGLFQNPFNNEDFNNLDTIETTGIYFINDPWFFNHTKIVQNPIDVEKPSILPVDNHRNITYLDVDPFNDLIYKDKMIDYFSSDETIDKIPLEKDKRLFNRIEFDQNTPLEKLTSSIYLSIKSHPLQLHSMNASLLNALYGGVSINGIHNFTIRDNFRRHYNDLLNTYPTYSNYDSHIGSSLVRDRDNVDNVFNSLGILLVYKTDNTLVQKYINNNITWYRYKNKPSNSFITSEWTLWKRNVPDMIYHKDSPNRNEKLQLSYYEENFFNKRKMSTFTHEKMWHKDDIKRFMDSTDILNKGIKATEINNKIEQLKEITGNNREIEDRKIRFSRKRYLYVPWYRYYSR